MVAAFGINDQDALKISRCPAKLVGHLNEIMGILTEMAGRIERLELLTANRLPPEDHRLLEKLLPALAGYFGSELFFTWQIDDPAILAMVGDDVVKTGSLLSRAADVGTAFDGYVIVRDKKRGNVRQWRVSCVGG